MANQSKTSSKNIKPRINLNHNTHNEKVTVQIENLMAIILIVLKTFMIILIIIIIMIILYYEKIAHFIL